MEEEENKVYFYGMAGDDGIYARTGGEENAGWLGMGPRGGDATTNNRLGAFVAEKKRKGRQPTTSKPTLGAF